MRYQSLRAALLLSFIAWPVLCTPSWSRGGEAEKLVPEAVAGEPALPDAAHVADRIEALEKIISAGSETAQDDGQRERISELRETLSSYTQTLSALERKAALEKESSALMQHLSSLPREEHGPPPYGLERYDSALDRLAAAREERDAAQVAADVTLKSLEEADKDFRETEGRLRAMEERLENGDAATPAQYLRSAGIKRERTSAKRDLARLLYENALLVRDMAGTKANIEEGSLRWIEEHLAYRDEDRQKTLRLIGERRVSLRERVASLALGQSEMQDAWLEALERFESSRGEDDVSRARAAALLEARDAWLETYRKLHDQSEQMHQVLNREEQVWERRYRLLQGAVDEASLGEWLRESSQQGKSLEREIAATKSGGEAIAAQISSLEKQLAGEELDDMLRGHFGRSVNALKVLSGEVAEHLTLLKSALARENRLAAEIRNRQPGPPWRALAGEAGSRLSALWQYEVWVLDGRAVTVRKVVLAVVILSAGVFILRWTMRVVLRRSLVAAGLKNHTVAVVEKIILYTVAVFLVLFALRAVNIPLSVFTILGGAVALGAGFGMRNLINNFISSFILMAERPVRIGDMIELDETFGLVEEIGARCTRIRTADDLHMLVPNSSLLEKNIVNWTLSDEKIRTSVSVGVCYGCDAGAVARILKGAAEAEEGILPSPSPYVLLAEFGESALQFTVYFWISLRSLMGKKTVESCLRFRIYRIFEESGIEMALPQRDVHIDASKPLDLRIVRKVPPLPETSARQVPS